MSIHALLVGINDYNVISKLRGCVNDVDSMSTFLTGNYPDIFIHKLVNSSATKTAIVEIFERLTNELTATDNFLLYFSGHGCLEYAHPLWHEPSRRLECIVCYDVSPDHSPGFLIADKELRYLIHKLSGTGCHILTIFDCCHSGGNTRNLARLDHMSPDQDIRARHYPYTFEEREWKDFVFGAVIRQPREPDLHIDSSLPQGSHVQMAACESDELALEVNGQGAFTQALLRILYQTEGNISYYNLLTRIRQYLRFVYQQQARLYSVGGSEDETHHLMHCGFLNGKETNDNHSMAEAVYNPKHGWLLNLGALHGLTHKTVVNLFDPATPGRYSSVSIQKIYIDHCVLDVADNALFLSNNLVVQAKVENVRASELKLHLSGSEGNISSAKQLADLHSGKSQGFILHGEESTADFCLHLTTGLIYLTRPGNQYRPILKPVELPGTNMITPAHTRQLLAQLQHLSKWNYIRTLQNNNSGSIIADPIEVSVTQLSGQNEQPLAINSLGNGISELTLEPFTKTHLRIQLTNRCDRRLFVGVAYLAYNFQVHINLVEGKVQLLHPDETFSLSSRGNAAREATQNWIAVHLPDLVQDYNWPGYSETLKIIVSEELFSHEALRLDPLPSPYTLKDREKNSVKSRSFDTDEAADELDSKGWLTQTLVINYPNALHNMVDRSRIQAMKAWDKMAFFAEELYNI